MVSAEEKQKNNRGNLLSNPRYWGAGRLRDGILCEIAGWKVTMNDEKGVLCIDDPESPFNPLEVWRFKSEITNIMHAEHRARMREEAAARAENRGKKDVAFPQIPVFNRENNLIEYPGDYHNEILRKLKFQDDE